MRYFACLLLLSASLFAADKRPVTVEVLGSDNTTQTAGVYSSGSAQQYGSYGTATGYAVPIAVNNVDIQVKIEGHPATLHCDTMHHWHCYNLRPGKYAAQVKGNNIWVDAFNWDGSEKHTLKYRIY